MTRAKEVETETFDGAGATAGLMLKRKPNSKSGYYGVIPNGKGWRTRVYKETKKLWDSIGTYTTAQEAANRLLLWLLISGNDTRVKILHIRNNFTP